MLYDLVRMANSEDQPERQLQAVAQAIVSVFSSWGVHDCAILQPDRTGTLQIQASAYEPIEKVVLSSDEKSLASWVMAHGRGMGLYDDSSVARSSSRHFLQRVLVRTTLAGQPVRRSLRLVPLKMRQKVIGILRLQVLDDPRWVIRQGVLEEQPDVSNASTTFFWTFLDQATSLIEQVRLRRENMRIELLQRTDALRAALLSSVSHDLRTPLTAIKAAASSMLQEDVQWDEEARRGFASLIEREADRLNRLVGNLLDLSRIEEGALKLDRDWYQLAELIHEVLDRLQPILRGRVIEVTVPETLPLVYVDYLALDQVLTNLLENAIRYTPSQSPIEVSAQWERAQISIYVADRGPGIAPDEQERIFDKFYRVLHQPNSSPGGFPSGSGLGLAVCRGLIEAHGGRIWAEARQEGGTIFCVVLPAGPQKEIQV